MLVKSKWNSYSRVIPPRVWTVLQQRNDRERFLANKLEPKSNEILRAKFVSGSVSEGVSMRASHPPLGLYLKEFGRVHPRKSQAQRSGTVGEGGAQEPLALGRPTCGVGRPQGGPPVSPFDLVIPQQLSSLKICCTAKSLLEKMSKLFFPKDFKTQKIFLVFL